MYSYYNYSRTLCIKCWVSAISYPDLIKISLLCRYLWLEVERRVWKSKEAQRTASIWSDFTNIFRKILFSHLFWLDSHFFCRSDFVTPWFREPRSAWLLLMHSNLFCLKSDRQKRCESSQKRCENRIFLSLISNNSWEFKIVMVKNLRSKTYGPRTYGQNLAISTFFLPSKYANFPKKILWTSHTPPFF